MGRIEILKILKEELECSEYRLANSCSRELTSYQLEVLEQYGIDYIPKPEPIYDMDESFRDVKHLSKLLYIYENKE